MTQQPEAVSPSPTPSVPARPEYTYSWESFERAGLELMPLMKQHYQEKFAWRDLVDMDIDWPKLFRAQGAGALHLLVVRANGAPVGYMTLLVTPHVMAADLTIGVIETFVMHPAYQDGWTMVKMLKRAAKKAKQLGARVLSCRDPENELGHVMRRLGFGMPETTYFKRLDLNDE